jgi:hypothetical protein
LWLFCPRARVSWFAFRFRGGHCSAGSTPVAVGKPKPENHWKAPSPAKHLAERP